MKEENQYANWMTKQWNKNDFSLTEKQKHNVVLLNLLQSIICPFVCDDGGDDGRQLGYWKEMFDENKCRDAV